MMVAYLTGACSSEEREIVEDHCLDCDACRAQLAALVHLVVSSAHERENQRRQVEALLPLGEQAAARARKVVRLQEGWDRQRVSPRAKWMNWLHALQASRPILAPALLVIALLGGGLIAYLSMWRQTPEDLTLARIREVYQDARVLQARVTGGFAHQQYVTTRGPGDIAGVDENRQIALVTELNQGSAGRGAAARHNLGRVFILHGDLEPAERQFLLALKERPRDAGLLADLGALYYERSLKDASENNDLLEKALEHTSKAIEIDPAVPEAWFNRALGLGRRGARAPR
jgi:tetratricopeptide (TPR) repeat protein